MKATLRKSGTKMFTISVKFHVDRDDLVAIVAYQTTRYGEQAWTRGSLFDRLRTHLHRSGLYSMDWREDLTEEEAEVVGRQANEIVDRLFPELKGATS